MQSGSPGYRIFKTAVNALTRTLTSELQGTNILVNSVCPGWVKTDMSGENASRKPQEGADTIGMHSYLFKLMIIYDFKSILSIVMLMMLYS